VVQETLPITGADLEEPAVERSRGQLARVASVAIALSYALLTHLGNAAVAGQASTPLTIRLDLQPYEQITGATAGNLADGPYPALVIGTAIPPGRGRVHVLHGNGRQYDEVWVSTNDVGVFESATIRDVNNNKRSDLVTLWRGGQGGYLDVQIFEWEGSTYRKLWQLAGFEMGGQLTQGASLGIRRIDDFGNVELVVRAPSVRPGESTLGPVHHQVSIYRWNAAKRTFVLYTRFVETEKSYN